MLFKNIIIVKMLIPHELFIRADIFIVITQYNVNYNVQRCLIFNSIFSFYLLLSHIYHNLIILYHIITYYNNQ